MKKLQIWIGIFLIIFLMTGCSGSNAKTAKPATTEYSEQTTDVSTEKTTEEEVFTKEDVAAMEAGEIISKQMLKTLDTDELFYAEKISDEVFSRMDGVSFGEGCVVSRNDLRYVRVLHTGFDGQTHIGELVCNKALADEFVSIFKELYEKSYPIEKMLLVDEYDGDDEKSMEDNNTSCFNFRSVPGSDHLSQHAYGRAIDVNPLYNPYVTSDGYTPVNAGAYVDRSEDTPYKIDTDDLCYKVFRKFGFMWGGSWNTMKDYQHFQQKEN